MKYQAMCVCVCVCVCVCACVRACVFSVKKNTLKYRLLIYKFCMLNADVFVRAPENLPSVIHELTVLSVRDV